MPLLQAVPCIIVVFEGCCAVGIDYLDVLGFIFTPIRRVECTEMTVSEAFKEANRTRFETDLEVGFRHLVLLVEPAELS